MFQNYKLKTITTMAKIKSTRTRQDPAFLLYSADFLVRSVEMTDEQIGKFIKLLCYQHQTGHMKKETMLLVCKEEDGEIFSRFIIDNNGLYYNKELDDEVKRRSGICETNKKNIEKYWEEKREKERQKGETNKEEKININHHIPEYDDE